MALKVSKGVNGHSEKLLSMQTAKQEINSISLCGVLGGHPLSEMIIAPKYLFASIWNIKNLNFSHCVECLLPPTSFLLDPLKKVVIKVVLQHSFQNMNISPNENTLACESWGKILIFKNLEISKSGTIFEYFFHFLHVSHRCTC